MYDNSVVPAAAIRSCIAMVAAVTEMLLLLAVALAMWQAVVCTPPPRTPSYPTLPTLTNVQQAVHACAAAVSATAAPAARPAVLALLATQKFLRQFDDASHLFELSAEALLDRFEAELETAELVHNFGFEHPRSCGADVTTVNVQSGPLQPQFYNQWVLQAVNITAVDPGNNRYMEITEVKPATADAL